MADDFDALIRDLSNVAGMVPREAKRSVQQAAMETKKQYRKIARKNPFGSQYTGTIDYELTSQSDSGHATYQADIGPNLGRYGGKTGKGGLVPSAGIFDDPQGSGGIVRPPDRSRRAAEKFAEQEVEKRAQRAIDESLKANGL